MKVAVALILNVALLSPASAAEKPADDKSALAALALRPIGPALMSGRIADIAIDPSDRSTWYVAAGSGGVWKTTNSGTTWTPIFEDQSSYSIGCVSVDPSEPNVIWVGTGENVSGRHVGFGDGVYKSLDAGQSWTRMGLEKSEHLSKILVDPRDSDVVYVAAEGPLWSGGGERGVYKTQDGGQTWARVLHVDDDTGVADLEFAPDDPDTLYAAAYQRRRSVYALYNGPGSGIHKSSDAGVTWTRLEKGLPDGDQGKIGLAVSPADPAVVYATIEASEKERGFYRSEDRGGSWEKRSDYLSNGTGPHYYQEIYASPHARDTVYQMDVWIHISRDGGKNFERLGEPLKHSDNHALAFDPDDPEHLIAGCDGGVYETFDHGKSWRFAANLPLTQYYKMALDNAEPFYNVIGGTQDNGTQLGPSRTGSRKGIRNADWSVPLGADGYACAIDPEDPNTLYVTWQEGHPLRVDMRTREQLDIQPQPAAGESPERWNWDAPLLISPHSRTRLYFGSQRLWRSDDRGESWRAVSGDLTKGKNRYELPMAGRVRSADAIWGNTAMSWYATTTAASESPLVEGLIYVGTDDGLIQVTEDGGESWRRIEKLAGVPDGFFVNDVKASRHAADTVYAAVDQHKIGDYAPYLLRSDDRGRTWRRINGDLPARHVAWAIEQDHEKADLLFAGTEFGIFFTRDAGNHWEKLAGPTIPFRDIEIQRRESDLVGASFGRSFFVLDDYSALRTLPAKGMGDASRLFPVRRAWWYVPSWDDDRDYQGGGHFNAENPAYGALFTYYLAEAPQTARERRREKEEPLEKAGKDVPFPGWDALSAEDREVEPAVMLIVRDSEGRVVRRLEGAKEKGFQRVAWDLRYAAIEPIELEEPERRDPWDLPPRGPLAPPGRYTAELASVSGGAWTTLGEAQRFDVVPAPGRSGDGDRDGIDAFQRRTAELYRRALAADAASDELESRLSHVRKALGATPGAEAAWWARERDLAGRLASLQVALGGNKTLSRFDEPQALPVLWRIGTVAGGSWDTTIGPTKTHRESLDIAEGQLSEATATLEAIRADLAAFEADLEKAGAPWTPGRELP